MTFAKVVTVLVCWVLSTTVEPLKLATLALWPTLTRLPARLLVAVAALSCLVVDGILDLFVEDGRVVHMSELLEEELESSLAIVQSYQPAMLSLIADEFLEHGTLLDFRNEVSQAATYCGAFLALRIVRKPQEWPFRL